MGPKQPNERGEWCALAIFPKIPWPESEFCQLYRGHKLWFIPSSDNKYPMVAIECSEAGVSSDEGYRILRQCLSSLVWAHSGGVSIEGSGGGSFAYRWEMPTGQSLIKSMHPVHLDYFPEPECDSAKLGLALYREALETSNPAYQVLGFFKIINILHGKGGAQIKWLNDHLINISSRRGKDRLKELKTQEKDIGSYLYTSGRCAVAHAFSEPVADPDDPQGYVRLSRDSDLIRELAEIFIETEFDVKSSQTIWREHLYELAGFKNVLGPRITQIFTNNDVPKEGIEMPDFPRISIRIRDCEIYQALEEMEVTPDAWAQDQILHLNCSKSNGISVAILGLNFAEERLHIDIEGGFAIYDDGSVDTARFAAEIMRFKGAYFMNGALEVWNVDNNNLLGRCDPYIPVNIMPYETSKNFERHAEKFDEIANDRKSKLEN
jgi:hypothetical protein